MASARKAGPEIVLESVFYYWRAKKENLKTKKKKPQINEETSVLVAQIDDILQTDVSLLLINLPLKASLPYKQVPKVRGIPSYSFEC